MFRNYIKSTVRNLLKNKTYATINVLGLALGISCCLTIFLIVKTELSFDTFHSKASRIYRVVSEEDTDQGKIYTAGTHYPLPMALKNDFPDLEQVVATRDEGGANFLIRGNNSGEDNRRFREESGVGFSQTSFFKVFDFKVLLGDPETLLDEPKTAVISRSVAEKYFGDENPLGKVLSMENTIDITITGVFEEFPHNTDFPFNKVIVSWESLREYDDFISLDKWNVRMSAVQTFILIPQGSSASTYEASFPSFTDKYLGETRRSGMEYFLQPLNGVHFDERFGNYDEESFSQDTLNALTLIGFFLIITACINFVNLSTALASKRAKEVGVRKVLGTTKAHLILQFLLETASILLISLLIGLGLTELILLNIQEYIEFNAPVQLQFDIYTLAFLLGLLILVGGLSGLYPSIVMARYSPIEALRSRFSTSRTQGMGLRKILVILQFTIAQVLIFGTLIVSQQISMFNDRDLGLDKDAILTVYLPGNDPQKLELLKTELLKSSQVLQNSFALGSAIGDGNLSTEFTFKELGDAEIKVALKFADQDYFDVFGLELLAGRRITDRDTLNNIVVNEALIKKININSPEEALGKKIVVFGDEPTIVGVVKDFHTMSLKSEIPPCIIASYGEWYFTANIKISPQNLTQGYDHVEKAWQTVFPDDVMNAKFLDDTVAEFYKDEQRVSRLFNIFSLIAIFISCMGVFGLVTFIAAQKTKEVGIRKVLGASVANIATLFSKEFFRLIIIALVIASPIAYYFMNQWLNDFAYRIDINPVVFAWVGIITIGVTGVTVGYKSLMSALANPVNSLRDE